MLFFSFFVCKVVVKDKTFSIIMKDKCNISRNELDLSKNHFTEIN